jgi:hypothetical protein
MLACFAAALRCLAFSARGGLAAAAPAALLTAGACGPAGWLAATLATGSDRSLRQSCAADLTHMTQCAALFQAHSIHQLRGLMEGRPHAQGAQAATAHMKLSSCVEVWPQEPHTTVDASRPLNRDSTTVASASEVGSARACDRESRDYTAAFQASPPTADNAVHRMNRPTCPVAAALPASWLSLCGP